jgi:hypothetical protein
MTDPSNSDAPIGAATMTDDGTLILDLRAEGEHGEVGDARIVIPPSDPHYEAMRTHLGALEPGAWKPVPPWPN